MDFQKVTTSVTAATVVGTGLVVGGNQAIDHYSNGPQKRQDAQIEQIRQVVAEEVFKQLQNAWPETSGPVKGSVVPKNYKNNLPK
tara:strand:- start:2881 stop:3135 length:255 start_codon:yes stop_codon:yes gene_type:complete